MNHISNFYSIGGSFSPEMNSTMFIILLTLSVACLTPILASIFKFDKIPMFIFQILLGIIIGPHLIGIIPESHDHLSIFRIIGLSFLVFLSGLDIDYTVSEKDRKSKKLPIVKLSFVMFGLVLITSALIAAIPMALGYSTDYLLMFIVFSATFAGVVVPIVHKDKIENTLIGQFIDTFASISEAFSLVVLSLYLIFTDVTQYDLISLVGMFSVLAIVLITFKVFRNKVDVRQYEEGMVYIGMRLAMLMLVSLIWLADKAGGEAILGAFLAGALIKWLKPSHLFETELKSIGFGIFIPFYFLIIGSELDVTLLSNINFIGLMLFTTFLLIISKVPLLLLSKWFAPKLVFTSSLLLTSTIVVSFTAAEVGVHYDLLTYHFAEALKFSSILLTIVSPILFEILFPFKTCDEEGNCKILIHSKVDPTYY